MHVFAFLFALHSALSAFAGGPPVDPFEYFGLKTPVNYQELSRISDQTVYEAYQKKMRSIGSGSTDIADMDEEKISETIDAYNRIRTMEKRVDYCERSVFPGSAPAPKLELQNVIDRQVDESLGVVSSARALGLTEDQIREAKEFFERRDRDDGTLEYWLRRGHVGEVETRVNADGSVRLAWKWNSPHYRDLDYADVVPDSYLGDFYFVRDNQEWIKKWIDRHDVLANYRLEAMLEAKRLEERSKIAALSPKERWERLSKDVLQPLGEWHDRQVAPHYASGDFDAFRQDRPRTQAARLFNVPLFATYVDGPYLRPIIQNLQLELLFKYLDLSLPLLGIRDSPLGGEPGDSETWHRTLNGKYDSGYFDGWIRSFAIPATDESGFYRQLRNLMLFNASMRGSYLRYFPRYDAFELIERSAYYKTLPESERDSFLVLKRLIEITDSDPEQYSNLQVPRMIHEVYRQLYALNEKMAVDPALKDKIGKRLQAYVLLAQAGQKTRHHYYYSRAQPELMPGLKDDLKRFVLENFPFPKSVFKPRAGSRKGGCGRSLSGDSE